MIIAKLSIHFNAKGVPFKSSFTPLLPVAHRPGHVFMPDGMTDHDQLAQNAYCAALKWFDRIPGVSDHEYILTFAASSLVEKKLSMEFHVEDAIG